MPPRYICVHGHFYQPPRENPWLEAVERQESAHPYHDWNQRITAECYAPNAAARILDDEGRIQQIMNNYGRISFNFGPTLLSWMEEHQPDVYAAVLDGDRRSARRFGGHGSALAQAYNHMIMPLANTRDRRTQIRWGLRDFEARFGRPAAGMWLAETAVDVETLELMAEEGVGFTILAPHQVEAVRPEGADTWTRVDTAETGRAYRVPLPSGREITVFFYDGPLSRAVAFERLLGDGEGFANRLMHAPAGGEAPLVHIATDGETYGHHHRNGEMGLSYALRVLEEREDVQLVNYPQYLALHPPTWEARIREDTSWSCAHGVERWRADCGCRVGGGADWNQAWRGPLRDALDWLRDQLVHRYEAAAAQFFPHPWEARDGYIDVVLDRSDETLDRFFEEMASRELSPSERTRALTLLELQRHAMLMYTSCGWFFDDVGGIEVLQVLRYAGRVVHLSEELFPDLALERPFLERLEMAVSNEPSVGDARRAYQRSVLPSRVDLSKAAAHYALSSIFEELGPTEKIYCYRFARADEERLEAGRADLVMGRVEVTSLMTRDSMDLSYAVLHLGNLSVTGGVRPYRDRGTYEALVDEVSVPFARTDFPTVIRVLDQEFEATTYSMRSLFRDAQLRIVESILESSVEEAESAFSEIYEERAPLLRFLADLSIPRPRPFVVAGEYVLNQRLKRMLSQPHPHLQAIKTALNESASAGLALDPDLAFHAENALEREMDRLGGTPADREQLARIRHLVSLLTGSSLHMELWRVQNAYWRLIKQVGASRHDEEIVADVAVGEDEAAEDARTTWLREFAALGEVLRVAIPRGEPAKARV